MVSEVEPSLFKGGIEPKRKNDAERVVFDYNSLNSNRCNPEEGAKR